MNSTQPSKLFNFAYDQGYEAQQHGLSRNSCLFIPGSNQYIAWHKGYDDSEAHEQDIVGDTHFGEYVVVVLLFVVVLSMLALLFIIHQ